jgi:hypothetical protein
MTDQELKTIMDREAKQAIAMGKAMQNMFDVCFKAKPVISDKTKRSEKPNNFTNNK